MKPNQEEGEIKLDVGYSGLAASLYDLWWGEEPLLDEAFYRRILKQFPGRALEVGCGTGRLLIPYLQDGFEVEGVDCSPEMLLLCRKKAERFRLKPLLYEQFMQKLDLMKHYKTIYVPFGSFQLLSNREDAFEALRRFYAYLEPSGQLLISTFVPWEELAATNQGQWKIRRTATRPEDGATVLCLQASALDRVKQVQTNWNRYEIYLQGQLVETEMKMSQLRWYFKYELMLMLEKVGWRDISTYGDYTDTEASEQHSTIIFSAKK